MAALDHPPRKHGRLEAPLWAAAGLLGLVAAVFFYPAQRPADGIVRDTPLQLSLQQWRRVFVGAAREFMEDRAPEVAAGITFFALLALFPAIAAIVSLYGLVADPSEVSGHVRALAGMLPRNVIRFIAGEMERIAEGPQASFGVAFGVSLAVSIWSANSGIKALFSGLNVAYETREHRNFVTLNLVSLAFTLGALLFIVLCLIVSGAINLTPAFMPRWATRTLNFAGTVVVMGLALSAIYRFGPCRPRVRWRWVTPGSVVTLVIWLLISTGFSFYIAHFTNYERTYGSLGAAIGLMVWLWVSFTAVLFGAELNAEIELRAKGLPGVHRGDSAPQR
jgi:membrane protein